MDAMLSDRFRHLLMFVFVPTGELSAPFSWYPIFTIGETSFGANRFADDYWLCTKGSRDDSGNQAVKAHGKQVVYFGFFITALAVSSYWYPLLAIVTVIMALLGRELIYYVQKNTDGKRAFYFSESYKGVKILGVIPHSPADKMGLVKGEIISENKRGCRS